MPICVLCGKPIFITKFSYKSKSSYWPRPTWYSLDNWGDYTSICDEATPEIIEDLNKILRD